MKRHKIYSRLHPETLLHIVLFGAPSIAGRQDISEPDQPLQVSIINAPPNHVFKAHYHIPKPCQPEHTTQECWVIEAGSVRVAYFDLDGTFLEEIGLIAGDRTLTLQGGHEYRIGPEGCRVTEIKSGPYTNQATDKVWL